MSRQLYDFNVHIEQVTPKALLVNDGVMEVWLPKSQIQCFEHTINELEAGDTTTLMIEEWLAIDKGFI